MDLVFLGGNVMTMDRIRDAGRGPRSKGREDSGGRGDGGGLGHGVEWD